MLAWPLGPEGLGPGLPTAAARLSVPLAVPADATGFRLDSLQAPHCGDRDVFGQLALAYDIHIVVDSV